MKKRFLALSLSAVMTFSLLAVSGNIVNAEEVNEELVIEEVVDGDETEAACEEDVVADEAEETRGVSDVIQFTEENFPDENFRNYLESEFAGKTYGNVYSILCSNKKIESLEGIELFPNLFYLMCNNNEITNLDLSMTPNLEYLYANNNLLTELDLSKNKKLQTVDVIYGNNIDTLDLRYLGNDINLYHTYYMPGNNLNTLYINIDQQVYLTNKTTATSSSDCVEIVEALDPRYKSAGTAIKGVSKGTSIINLSESMNNTSKAFSVIVGSEEGITPEESNFPEDKFPDPVFRAYLEDKYKTANYSTIFTIDLYGLTGSVKSLKGIELLPNVSYLNCANQKELTELDLHDNKELTSIYAYDCALESIDVTGLTKLVRLYVGSNKLTELDVTTNTNLSILSCEVNKLTELDIAKCTKLTKLLAYSTNIASIDFSNCPDLEQVDASVRNKTVVDITNNTALKEFFFDSYLYGCKLKDMYMPVGMEVVVGSFASVESDKTAIASIGTGTDSRYKKEASTIKANKLGVCTITITDNYSNTCSFKLHVGDISSLPTPVLNSMSIESVDSTDITGKLDVTDSNERGDYRISFSKDNGETWTTIKDWSSDTEFSVKPAAFGEMIIRAEIRVDGDDSTIKNVEEKIDYHPCIKGNCQMPYGMIEPGEPGYLIGLETYPDSAYTVEMLILDCTYMQWTYTTGKNYVPENMLWTVWQPQYGYYWTLFRVYDEDENLIDEVCYGFENI